MKEINLKPVSNNTSKNTNDTSKKSEPKKTTAPKKAATIPAKIQRADKLRIQNKADMAACIKLVNEWGRKIDRAKTKEDHRKIDSFYEKKVKRLEEKEEKSYVMYYNYVKNNFTKNQQRAAFRKPGNFMSKSYINGLAKAVRQDEKRNNSKNNKENKQQ